MSDACVHARSVLPDSVRPQGLQSARLLRPWDSPGKSTGELPCPPPGDRPKPGIKPDSLVEPALQAGSLLLSHWGSPSFSLGIR